jgi:hypothetical protein
MVLIAEPGSPSYEGLRILASSAAPAPAILKKGNSIDLTI